MLDLEAPIQSAPDGRGRERRVPRIPPDDAIDIEALHTLQRPTGVPGRRSEVPVGDEGVPDRDHAVLPREHVGAGDHRRVREQKHASGPYGAGCRRDGRCRDGTSRGGERRKRSECRRVAHEPALVDAMIDAGHAHRVRELLPAVAVLPEGPGRPARGNLGRRVRRVRVRGKPERSLGEERVRRVADGVPEPAGVDDEASPEERLGARDEGLGPRDHVRRRVAVRGLKVKHRREIARTEGSDDGAEMRRLGVGVPARVPVVVRAAVERGPGEGGPVRGEGRVRERRPLARLDEGEGEEPARVDDVPVDPRLVAADVDASKTCHRLLPSCAVGIPCRASPPTPNARLPAQLFVERAQCRRDVRRRSRRLPTRARMALGWRGASRAWSCCQPDPEPTSK